jgi:hypothetical protein
MEALSKQSMESMLKELEGKVSPVGRALPELDKEWRYHVEERIEVGTKKQVKGLLRHCMPILKE